MSIIQQDSMQLSSRRYRYDALNRLRTTHWLLGLGGNNNTLTSFIMPWPKNTPSHSISITSGGKRYELSDWLGNVRVVINDRKTAVNSGSITLSYIPQIINVTDYYSFGSEITERSYEVHKPEYRMGFQGQQKDNEIYGKGNAYYFKYREEDARIGRFWSVDPLTAKYPAYSPYSFAMNRLVDGVELEGLEWKKKVDKQGKPVEGPSGGYIWVGYNQDGTPKEDGTVPVAAYAFEMNGKKYLRMYYSDTKTRTGYLIQYAANEYGMVELPVTNRKGQSGEFMSGNIGYKIYNYEGNDQYGSPQVIANAINSAIEYSIKHAGEYVSFGDFSNSKGQTFNPHTSHKQGKKFDWIILDTKGKNIFSPNYPIKEMRNKIQDFVDILHKNKFTIFILPSKIAGEIKRYEDAIIIHRKDHDNHGHTGQN